MYKVNVVLAILMVVLGAVVLHAQSGLGEIAGFISDEDGKGVEDVRITVSSESMIGKRTITSGIRGYYRVINLPPGKYSLTFTKDNYQAQEISGVSVRAGATSNLNVTLKVGEFADTFVITQEAPLIDIQNPERSLNIDGEFIKRLPITYDREWDSVWSLVPGVVNEGQYGPYGNRVEVHGADIFQNVWNMDGMSINDPFTNANIVYFSPDVIEEVHVITAGFDARVGSGAGGYVNVVTKSGGNEFHGAGSFTFQPNAWNWSNVEGGDAAELEIYLPELSVGGPIVKDQTWFFGTYRYNMRNEGYARTASQLEVFDILELPRPTEQRETRRHEFFGKVTHQLTDGFKIVGSFNMDEGKESHADMRTNGTTGSGVEIEEGGKLYSLKVESVLGSNFSATLGGTYYKGDNLIFGTGGFNEPSITRYSSYRYNSAGNITGSGTAAYYNNRSSLGWGSDTTDERLEFRGDARYFLDDFHGSHEVSFGFSAMPHQEALSNAVYSSPAAIYETKNAQGEWVQFFQRVYEDTEFESWDFGVENYAGYVQDTWVVSDRLTVSAGLRIESQRDGVVLDITEFSPHVGVNYAITGSLRDSVRASYGIRHNLLAGREGAGSTTGGSSLQYYYYDNDLDGTWDVIQQTGITDPGEPTDPNALTDYYGNPITYSDDLGMPYAHEFQAGYTRLLPYDMKLDLAFIYRINKNSQYEYDRNVIYENGEFVGLRNLDYESDYLIINDELSSRHYQSYEVSLTKEFSNGWQLMGSYTYQSSVLQGEWQTDNPLRYMHPESWFESPDDSLRPHIFRVAAFVVLPYDFTFSGNVLLQSGTVDAAKFMPYGTGVDVPQYFTLPNDDTITHPFWSVRPYYQPRNEDREVTMDNLAIVNIGIGKDFQIMGHQFQGMLQVFNLFNSDSFTSQSYYNAYVDENGDYYYSGYPSYSWIQPPRVMQLMVKYVF